MHSHQEDIRAFKTMMHQANYSQNTAYHQELDKFFEDPDLVVSSYFGIYMLMQVQRQESQQEDRSTVALPALPEKSHNRHFVKVHEHLQIYHFEVFYVLYLQFGRRFDVEEFASHETIQKKVVLLVEYMVKNNLLELSKQFFKMIPLSTLIQTIIKNPSLNKIKYSYFINIVYKLIYRVDLQLDDQRSLMAFYQSFKTHFREHRTSQQTGLTQYTTLFLMALIQNNY